MIDIPLHPILVHFPIAMFVLAFLFEAASWIFKKGSFHETAWHLFICGAVFTPLVYWTGHEEAERLNLQHPVLTKHRFFALSTMWGAIVSLVLLWGLKQKCAPVFKRLFWAVLAVLLAVVVMTGYFGGEMVYEYGVGTGLW